MKLFLITLSLFSAIQLLSADTEIESRSKDYCASLRGQNISHHSARGKLRAFFKSDEDLSTHIVMLYYHMNEKKLKNFYVLDCKVMRINHLSEDEAEVEYKLTGNWLLFLHKDIQIIDRWKRERGEWFIIPREILKEK